MARVRDPLDPKISLWHFLAYALRFEREKHGLSLTQCGQIIGAARSTVSNIEAGRLKLHEEQAIKLDKKYNTPRLFEMLLWFAQRVHDPDWFREYTQYEPKATIIRIYQGKLVPVPLQVEDYARAFVAISGTRDVEGAVAARMERQRVLLGHPTRSRLLVTVLDEEALHRPIGGRDVMKTQLHRLLELSERPDVIVRVIPRSAGEHIGLDGPFQIISLESRDIAYIGAYRGGRLVEAPSEVQEINMDFERLSGQALNEDDTRVLIGKVLEEYR